MFAGLDTVGQWLDAEDAQSGRLDDDDWWLARLQRQHGLQIAIDVIAHAQNMPLRLLRRRNLASLDNTFVELARDPKWKHHFQSILSQHGSAEARAAAAQRIDSLLDASHVGTLRDWVLSLATHHPQDRPDSLPPHYESWFLDLLPHLERQVWLTDMANPHPAHSLARMLEHWSLYVLMWAWKHEHELDVDGVLARLIPNALDTQWLGIAVTHAFRRPGRKDGHDIVLLGGPFELSDEDEAPRRLEGGRPASQHWFFETFSRFVNHAYARVPAWKDILEKAPSATELADAFCARPPFSGKEVERRISGANAALLEFRTTSLHASVQRWPSGKPGRPISRANWETIAALASWTSRWRPRFETIGVTGLIHVTIPGHRLSLLSSWRRSPSAGEVSDNAPSEMESAIVIDGRLQDAAILAAGAASVDELIVQLQGEREDLWIETPAAFLARARERQHALWASQASAISNLLARHSRRERPVGPDNLPGTRSANFECEEADHLLRGYGGRVCQYLLQMARADIASVLWLDYSTDPPRLRHVGGADRLIQHRAERQPRFEAFSVKTADERSRLEHSQLYRGVKHAEIEPQPEDRRVGENGDGGAVNGFFTDYEAPRPLDAVSVPLLVHGRVIGAFSLSGVSSPRQFDTRLYAPLRLVAQHLAQAMAMQSQLWQMRQLNWLASHRPLEEWRRHDSDNGYNPLHPVARTLANIFLCPVVHIWLRDAQNEHRFKLHGYTRPDLLTDQQSALVSAPSFELDDPTPRGPVPLGRHFAAFAVDQWTEGASLARGERAGSFVQARLYSESAPEPEVREEMDRVWPEAERLPYSRESAERGLLLLGDDFLHAAEAPDYRRAVFERAGLHQCMAFALVDASEAPAQPAGVIGLYADATRIGDSLLPWPNDWRPVVAHMQTYLPYLLMQTEAIANPLERMRRYLLHEGRNELNHVAATASTLRTGLRGLLAVDTPDGQVRPWLRHNLPVLTRLAKGPAEPKELAECLRDTERFLDQLGKLVERSAELTSHLLSGEFSENLAVMARLIGNQRSLAQFDPNSDSDFDHAAEWFSPKAELQAAFDSYQEVWKALTVQPDLSAVPDDLELLTSKRFWNLLTRDLVHNVAKYALPNEPIRVGWTRPSRRETTSSLGMLKVSNFGSYNSALDRPERLGAYGVKGSAGRGPARLLGGRVAGLMREGQGIGLWGAIEISKVIDMLLTIDVRPRNETVALYLFNIAVPARLARGGRSQL